MFTDGGNLNVKAHRWGGAHTHTHTHTWSESIFVRDRQTHTHTRSQTALSKIKISLCSWTWRYESSLSSQPVAQNIKRLSASLQLPGSPLSLSLSPSLSAYIWLHLSISTLARLWDQTHSWNPRGPRWKWIAITASLSPTDLSYFFFFCSVLKLYRNWGSRVTTSIHPSI